MSIQVRCFYSGLVLALTALLCALLLCSCAPKETPSPNPYAPTGQDAGTADGAPAQGPSQAPSGQADASQGSRNGALPQMALAPNDTIYVRVEGGTQEFNDDLASLLSATMQSNLGINPADGPDTADVLLDVNVHNVRVDAVGTKINPSKALANTALATSLGLAVGSAADYLDGAIWGAGIGAAVGLGATMLDSDKEYTWAMDADVNLRRRGSDGNSVTHVVRTKGTGMEQQEEAEISLKNQLCDDIIKSLRVSSPPTKM